jgi:glycosyltransferase involved in cell wall biosynthesis
VEEAGLAWRAYDLDVLTTGSFRRALSWLSLALQLRRRGGLAHVHNPGVYRLLLPALRLAGLRTVVHVQIDTNPEEFRWALRSPPDLILTCARYMISPIRAALGASGEKVRIEAVPNCVDTERFRPGDRPAAKQLVGAPADRPLALMLANLAPHKGQETAIRAVAELQGRGIALECWLAGVERGGRQEYQTRLRALAAELGVADRVRFLGQRTDAPDLLRASDFFLLPSTREGLPLSILEAQACKVPVLANPTAGMPEAVRDGETGYLIPAEDAEGYAERMFGLLRDADQYRRIAEHAFARVTREYDQTAFCERVGGLYREVLGRGEPDDAAPPEQPGREPAAPAARRGT